MTDSSDCSSDNGERKDKPTTSCVASFYSKKKIGKWTTFWTTERLQKKEDNGECYFIPRER